MPQSSIALICGWRHFVLSFKAGRGRLFCAMPKSPPTTGQRLASALKLLDYEKEQAKERQGARTDLRLPRQEETSDPIESEVNEAETKAAANRLSRTGVENDW
jgi:hypothetical protein